MADVDRYAVLWVAEARAQQQQREETGTAKPASRTFDQQMLASAKREVLRHRRLQRANARRQSARTNAIGATLDFSLGNSYRLDNENTGALPGERRIATKRILSSKGEAGL